MSVLTIVKVSYIGIKSQYYNTCKMDESINIIYYYFFDFQYRTLNTRKYYLTLIQMAVDVEDLVNLKKV